MDKLLSNMKLYNLFEDIILEAENLLIESVDFNTVRDSIDNKYNVNIVYVDGDGVRTNRYIQPYVLGDTLASNKAIRAYQIFGGSRTMATKGENAQGGWRIFRLDRIVDWKPTKMKFTIPVSDLPSFMISNGTQEPIQVPVQQTEPTQTQKTLSPKPTKPKIKAGTIKPNRYSTGKDPNPNIEPEKPLDTSKTTGIDTSKTTAQPINKKEKI